MINSQAMISTKTSGCYNKAFIDALRHLKGPKHLRDILLETLSLRIQAAIADHLSIKALKLVSVLISQTR